MHPASGSRLGPYEILSPVGAGSMGEVYRARDPRLGSHLAARSPVAPDRLVTACLAKDPAGRVQSAKRSTARRRIRGR